MGGPDHAPSKECKKSAGRECGGYFARGQDYLPGGHARGMRISNSENTEKFFCPHPGEIVSYAITSDGRFLASGTTEIKVWNVGTGKAEASLGGYKAGIFSLAFSPNGKLIASGSDADSGQLNFRPGEIKLWNVAAKKELATIISHKDLVSLLAFSPDGTILASGGEDEDCTIKLWRVADFDK